MATQAAPALPPAAREGQQVTAVHWIILVGLITAAILEILDTTIVNVALPQMAGNLGATAQEISWVSTGYILSNVIVLPMTAWLSGRFGRKRYMTGSILLFMAASFFCGTSRSLVELVFWRIIQGSGGAALLSTVQATLREIFPKDMQGTVQGIYTLGVIMAPTLGPTVGGWITDNWSWPWVFFVNLPIGTVAASITYLFLWDAPYQKRAPEIDWPGIGLLAVGLGSLQYVLEEGNSEDWFDSSRIVWFSVISGIAVITLIIWELWPSNQHPVVNFRVMKNRELSAALFLFVALGFGLYGGVFLFPLFAQNILGFTATVTGLVLLPGGIGTGISAMICARLLNKGQLIPPKLLIFLGNGLFVWSMWTMGHLTNLSGEPDTRWALIWRGFGLGFLFVPITLAALSTLKPWEIPQATAMMNLMRQLGGSFGIALLATYLTNMTAFHQSRLAEHIYNGNPLYQQRLQQLTSFLMSRGYDAVSAQKGAIAIIARTIGAQASTMAFNNAFQLIGLFTLCVSPAILLLKTGRKPPQGVEMGH